MAASATAALSGIGLVSNVLGESLDYQSEVLLSLARNLIGFDKHLFHIFYQRSAIYL